jgi:hypothetical protein
MIEFMSSSENKAIYRLVMKTFIVLLDLSLILNNAGAWCSVVVKALCYNSEGPGIFSVGSTQPLKMSTSLILGVKAAGA